MKVIYIFLTILLSISSLYGQKVKTKGQKVKASFHSLPQTGFSHDISAYSVELGGKGISGLQALGKTESGVKNSIQIAGYTKIEEPVAGRVVLNLEGPIGESLKLQTANKKSKDGKTWKEYHYTVDFSGSMNVKVTDKVGTVLHEDVKSYAFTKKSNVYRSSTELKKKFKSTDFYFSGRKAVLSSLIEQANATLNSQFGYPVRTEKIEFRRLSHKKHPEFKEWEQNESVVEKAFETLTAEDNNQFKENIQPAIDFWKEREKTYSASDKEQKKLKSAALQNLSWAYAFCDDFESALDYAQQMINVKQDEKKGKRLLKRLTETNDAMLRLDRPTRFFVIEKNENVAEAQEEHKEEVAAAIESGDVRSFPDFDKKMRVEQHSVILKSTMYGRRSKKSVGVATEGYVVFENELKENTPDFREPKKIRLAYDKDGVVGVGTPNFGQLDSLLIDTTMYRIHDVTIGSGMAKLKIKNAVVETLESYKRTDLVMVVAPYLKGKRMMQTVDMVPSYSIYKKDDQKYYPVEGLLGSFTKAMTRIFEDCPQSIDYIEGIKTERKKESTITKLSGFDNSQEIVDLLEIYDTCK